MALELKFCTKSPAIIMSNAFGHFEEFLIIGTLVVLLLSLTCHLEKKYQQAKKVFNS